MVDLKKLKELVKLMKDNDLTELDLRDEKEQISLKRGSSEPVVHYVPPPAGAALAAPAALPAPPPDAAAPAPAQAPAGNNLLQIKSPMVGTFYAASAPDAEPFVTPGAKVNPDVVVCIVEAMKVFNEIKSTVTGTIEKVLVESGQAIEFDQPLFLVKPD